MEIHNMFVSRNSSSSVKAFIKVKTSEGLVIDGFRVIDGPSGLFVGWPTKEVNKNGQKEYYSVVHADDEPETYTIKNSVNNFILEHYVTEMSAKGVTVNWNPEKKNDWASKGKAKVKQIQEESTETIIQIDDSDWA